MLLPLEQYLEDLQCPFGAQTPEAARWLLSQAVGLDYKDDGELDSALAKLTWTERILATKYNAAIAKRTVDGRKAQKSKMQTPFPDGTFLFAPYLQILN